MITKIAVFGWLLVMMLAGHSAFHVSLFSALIFGGVAVMVVVTFTEEQITKARE